MAITQPAPVAAPPGLTPASSPPAEPVAVGVFVYDPTDPGANGTVRPATDVPEAVAAALAAGRPVGCLPLDTLVHQLQAAAFLGGPLSAVERGVADGHLTLTGRYGVQVRFGELLAYRTRVRIDRARALEDMRAAEREMGLTE